ncbi:MAG: class I SAM-dependent methyltransferase, partial [Anaerolineales bacterium]
MENTKNNIAVKLNLLPRELYNDVEEKDPIRFYYYPFIGNLYRQRVELCLSECTGGERVLDVGFGSGVNFLNLNEIYKEIHGLDLETDIEVVKSTFEKIGIQTHLKNGNVLNMPYSDGTFDTVILVSILEHIKPDEQKIAFQEIKRVLKSSGQVVYGVPVEHPLMVFAFRLLGVNIREHHFSTEKDVANAAQNVMEKVRIADLRPALPIIKSIYQV